MEPKFFEQEKSVTRVEDAGHIREIIQGTFLNDAHYSEASDEELVSFYNAERDEILEKLKASNSKGEFLSKDGYLGHKMDSDVENEEFERYCKLFEIPDEFVSHLKPGSETLSS